MNQEKLLLIPGPTPVHPRILNALSQPTVSHVSPTLVAELKEALSNLKKIVFCQRGEPFIIAGAGTLAMEMALLNSVAKGERILILSQGFFRVDVLQSALRRIRPHHNWYGFVSDQIYCWKIPRRLEICADDGNCPGTCSCPGNIQKWFYHQCRHVLRC